MSGLWLINFRVLPANLQKMGSWYSWYPEKKQIQLFNWNCWIRIFMSNVHISFVTHALNSISCFPCFAIYLYSYNLIIFLDTMSNIKRKGYCNRLTFHPLFPLFHFSNDCNSLCSCFRRANTEPNGLHILNSIRFFWKVNSK